MGGMVSLLGLAVGIGSFLQMFRLIFPQLHSTGSAYSLANVILFYLTMVGGVIIHYGHRIRLLGRGYLAKVTQFPGADESFVLYLRSFRDDKANARLQLARPVQAFIPIVNLGAVLSGGSIEEILVKCVRSVGRVIAAGVPGEVLPPVGAQRLYLPLDNWKQPILDLMCRARMVVIVLDTSPGTLWEYVEAIRVVPPARLLLVPSPHKRNYDDFRAQASVALRDRAAQIYRDTGKRWSLLELPEYVPPPFSIAGLMPLSGLVSFSSDWVPKFARFMPLIVLDSLQVGVKWHVRAVQNRLVQYEDSLLSPNDSRIEARTRRVLMRHGTGVVIFVLGLSYLFPSLGELAAMSWDFSRANQDWWLASLSSVVLLGVAWSWFDWARKALLAPLSRN